MATRKKASKKLVPKKIQPLYGRPVDLVLKRGDIVEMRKVSTQARTYFKSVQAALKTLDARIGKAG
jgi:hypothetical protein